MVWRDVEMSKKLLLTAVIPKIFTDNVQCSS